MLPRRGTFYEQTNGAAMGSPLSPVLTSIFMEDFQLSHQTQEVETFCGRRVFHLIARKRWARFYSTSIVYVHQLTSPRKQKTRNAHAIKSSVFRTLVHRAQSICDHESVGNEWKCRKQISLLKETLIDVLWLMSQTTTQQPYSFNFSSFQF